MQSQAHSHPVIDSPQSVGGQKANSLWRVAVLIMAIVFGPALVAWALTLIR